jgi:hypothetical protein
MKFIPTRRRTGATLLAVLAIGGLAFGAARVNAAGPSGPDTCLFGFVWRDARPGDHVCVTPATRNQTATDNSLAASRRSPDGGPYGADTCNPGFVWREAVPGDHVCVPPAARSQAAADNAAGPRRRALNTYSATGHLTDGQYVRGDMALDLNPNGAFSFRGHLHNNGVAGYNVSTVCVVKLMDGSAISFSDSGYIKGDADTVPVIGSGGNKSRDWDKPGTSGQVANQWAKIAPGTQPVCRTSTTLGVAQLIDQIKKIVDVVVKIIAIV